MASYRSSPRSGGCGDSKSSARVVTPTRCLVRASANSCVSACSSRSTASTWYPRDERNNVCRPLPAATSRISPLGRRSSCCTRNLDGCGSARSNSWVNLVRSRVMPTDDVICTIGGCNFRNQSLIRPTGNSSKRAATSCSAIDSRSCASRPVPISTMRRATAA